MMGAAEFGSTQKVTALAEPNQAVAQAPTAQWLTQGENIP